MRGESTDQPDLTALALRARPTEPTTPDQRAALTALLQAIIDNRSLRPTIRRFLFNEDDVANAEQQALVAVSFNLASWSGDGDVRPWLRTVAANEAKMIIRARDRRRQHEAAASNATRDYVERLSSHLATQADLDRCLAQLSPDLAKALALRREGFAYDEIAKQLSIPIGTAKTRVRTARRDLAHLLQKNFHS